VVPPGLTWQAVRPMIDHLPRLRAAIRHAAIERLDRHHAGALEARDLRVKTRPRRLTMTRSPMSSRRVAGGAAHIAPAALAVTGLMLVVQT
jgi:hypothetical protein